MPIVASNAPWYIVVFFSSSSFSFAYSLARQGAYGQNFQILYLWLCSLATELSTEEILVFPFACDIHHRSIFSKFDSFACGSCGTIFDTYINKHLKSFAWFWPVCEVVSYVTLDVLINWSHKLMHYTNCLIILISGLLKLVTF